MLSEFISTVSDLAVIVGVIVAIYEINSWKGEIRWEKYCNVAERAMLQLYRIDEIIKEIRNPLSFSYEYSGRKPGENEDSKSKSALDIAYTVNNRINSNFDTINNLRPMRDHCTIIFGSEQGKYFSDAYNIILEIRNAANGLGRYYLSTPLKDVDESERGEFKLRRAEYQKIIWRDQNDNIDSRMAQIISNAEMFFSKYYRVDGPSFKFAPVWANIKKKLDKLFK